MKDLDKNTKIMVQPSTPLGSAKGKESHNRRLSSPNHLAPNESTENDKLVEPPPPTKIKLRPSTPTASLEHHHQGHQQENRVGKSDSGNHLVPISERETRSSRSSRSSRSAYTLNRSWGDNVRYQTADSLETLEESSRLNSERRKKHLYIKSRAWGDDASFRTSDSWETIESSELNESERRQRALYKCKCLKHHKVKVLTCILGIIGIVTITLVVTGSLKTSVDIEIGCKFNFLVGNGKCDDISNVDICNYDGGDCCLKNAIAGICCQCQCHSSKTSIPSNECSTISTTIIQTISTTQQQTSTSATTSAFNSKPCDDDWNLINGTKCIFVSEYKSGFESAEFDCLLKGGNVFEPRQLDFESEVHAYLDASHTYWIGISKEEGEFIFALSGDNIAYDNFFPSEPSNGPQEDCVMLDYFANKWRWYDTLCAGNNKYICEKEPYLLTG